ncbi:isochorismatase [Gammaproteobacteria bacterium 45_16_T64]|nr:isochorismatase [Gammaproteobacteria bacterium 45_16_T64]
MTTQESTALLAAINSASNTWKQAFNEGNAAGCAAQYEPDATMQANPFGTFIGTEAITNFWQKLIDDGFSDVEYALPKIEVVDSRSAILSANWTMNKASGVIHKELWVLQDDGSAKLREDVFEALA